MPAEGNRPVDAPVLRPTITRDLRLSQSASHRRFRLSTAPFPFYHRISALGPLYLMSLNSWDQTGTSSCPLTSWNAGPPESA